MRKPTVDQLKRRFEAYQTYYGQLHQDQKEIDDYYELVFPAQVPKRYPKRVPSTARDWVDVGVRHFTLDNPRVRVPRRNNSQAARKQVEAMETFYNFYLQQSIAVIKESSRKLLLRGETFLKNNMDDTYYGSEAPERMFHFPLYLTCPDPINTFASPAHNGVVPHDVIECFYITVDEARSMCERNKWNWKTKKQPNALVKWFSFISAEWRCFMIDDEPVLTPAVQVNLLGFCPYVHIDAAAGQDGYEGKPEYKYRSLIWGKRDMLKMEVRNLSQIDAINMRYAWPKVKIKGDPALIDKHYPHGVSTDPDELLKEIPGIMEIEVMQGEQVPNGLFTQHAMIQGYALPPAVLSGMRPAGVYSGEHQESLVATAKPVYKDAFKNLEIGLAVNMGMGARIIERVYKSPLEIKDFSDEQVRRYSTITPTIIGGHYDCDVVLLAEPPEATDMRKALGKALRQAKSISLYTELTQYHDMSEKDAMDEIAQIFAEMAMESPAVQAVVAKNAMERLGMDKEKEALEDAEREERQRMGKSRPPIQKGEGLNMAGVKRRGRKTPDLGRVPSTTENKMGRV